MIAQTVESLRESMSLLRISRHDVHNELMFTKSVDRLQNAALKWGRSKDLHKKYLEAFSRYPEWAATEAFMGYTFLGSSVSKIGTSDEWKKESCSHARCGNAQPVAGDVLCNFDARLPSEHTVVDGRRIWTAAAPQWFS